MYNDNEYVQQEVILNEFVKCTMTYMQRLKNYFLPRGVTRISRRGVFQIGSNENGWSKILTLGMYKTLAFMLRKEKTPWLPLSERVYHFLEIYVSVVILVLLMFINASPDSRSLDMVNLRYVFNLLSVLSSHSADVIGNVHKMRIKVWMLGKNSRSHAASVWTALVGRSASSVLHHFLFHRRSSTSTTWGEGRSFS